MRKELFLFFLLLYSSLSFADLKNTLSNVNSCLKGSSPGPKGDCVQAQISAEKNNQIATLFKIYATAANNGIEYYTSQPGGYTPNSPGGKGFGGAGAGAPTGAAPAYTGPATSTEVQTTQPSSVQSPGATTPPPQQPRGGIQYY